MDLEDLRAAQVDERGTDSPRPLPASFYEQAADYLARLRERRDVLAERSDDPFESAEVRRLADEIATAGEVVEAVYERRVGKVVKQASLAAAGMPADDEGLTEEERALYADLVERIEANRATVLDAIEAEGGATRSVDADAASPAGEAAENAADATGDAAAPERPTDGSPVDETADDPRDAPPTLDAGEAETSGGSRPGTADDGPEPDGGSSTGDDESARRATPDDSDREPTDDSDREPTDDPDPDRLTVRITADVGEIYGVDDRVYTLDSEDVVTLPAANARPLLDRGAAQRVD